MSVPPRKRFDAWFWAAVAVAVLALAVSVAWWLTHRVAVEWELHFY